MFIDCFVSFGLCCAVTFSVALSRILRHYLSYCFLHMCWFCSLFFLPFTAHGALHRSSLSIVFAAARLGGRDTAMATFSGGGRHSWRPTLDHVLHPVCHACLVFICCRDLGFMHLPFEVDFNHVTRHFVPRCNFVRATYAVDELLPNTLFVGLCSAFTVYVAQ